MSPEEELRQTVAHIQTISQQYLNGDPAPFMACWSHADDVTIFGAWGAYERGWAQVGPRLEWGAARYRGGHSDFELLSLSVSGDLGFTVWIERGEARVEGLDEPRPMGLRVTQLYRREPEGWKIIHRHGDAITDKIAAAAVLQQ
jgi:ketosteroid isomerase-like protein